MTVVEDSLAEQIAGLVPIMSAPSGELGYGSDLSCDDDIDKGFAEVSGDDQLGIAQSLYRRLITPRGALIDDPDYGYQVAALVHQGLSDADLRAAAGAIHNELVKDDRLDDVVVTLARETLDTLTLSIQVQPSDPLLENFELTLALSNGALLIEEF